MAGSMNVTSKAYQPPMAPVVAIAPGARPTSKSTAVADPLSVVGKLVGAALPDALVYSNNAMLATANKQFVLVNPAGFGSPTGRGATLFTSHTGSLNGKTPSGLNMNRVSARHFNLSNKANGIEEGQGVVQKTGQGDKEVTFFLNTRAGTTAAGKNGNLSAQFGWFGSAAAMKGVIAKMPSSGAGDRSTHLAPASQTPDSRCRRLASVRSLQIAQRV